jgi:hypothetical protein
LIREHSQVDAQLSSSITVFEMAHASIIFFSQNCIPVPARRMQSTNPLCTVPPIHINASDRDSQSRLSLGRDFK